MPRTGTSCSSLLGIRLEGDQHSYAPGDTIIGCVYRRNHVVSANASIFISVSGRTKTKIVVSRGNSTSTYRGRFNLIPPRNRQKIFQGPLHIEFGGDEQVWPFAITLPKYVDPDHLQNGEQSESFLPLRTADHVLPSTYTYPTVGHTEAFVEYYLTAAMHLGGKSETVEATLPITVAGMDPTPPIADFGLKRARSSHQITTYRLVPGMDEVKLSFSQKFKQALQTTSVPQFAFDLFVGLPTTIQLDNPNPLPVQLHVVPNRKDTSEVLHDVPQKVKLSFLSIQVVTTTEVMCEGTFTPHTKDKNAEVNLGIMNVLSRAKDGIYIPCTNDCSPIDIGAMIDLRLGCFGPGFPHRRGVQGHSFNPSFTTYNIRQSHRLKWEIRGTIAGELFKENGAIPVKLLAPSDERGPGPFEQDQKVPAADVEAGGETEPIAGPSQIQRNESWIQPPAEEEAPPSFIEVVKEDAARPPEKAGT
ncbi:hypothetical protein FSPOR_10686 [Fusarium sporotrichioides]|uniref:Arrestin-like N-terminal domain-containing protein n=1 Tax=Fusarium sporotrichioides TaxID=5514 RepID=A0A395RJT4_FUSSP|nr:hypothetical protein FSPOR_10686 [Fusarium sporotrichioides]